MDGDPSTVDAIYTYGHRNAFDFTFHPNGQLLSTENGPSYDDEINWIVEGRNYGWNLVVGFPDTPAVYVRTVDVSSRAPRASALWIAGSPGPGPLTIHGSRGSVVRIYDVAGRKVDTLEIADGAAVWAPQVPPGLYFERLHKEVAKIAIVQ